MEKIVDKADPVKVYPLAGPCQLVHKHYKCTVYYDELSWSDHPVPSNHVDHKVEVVYIDKDFLRRGPNAGSTRQGPGRPARSDLSRDRGIEAQAPARPAGTRAHHRPADQGAGGPEEYTPSTRSTKPRRRRPSAWACTTSASARSPRPSSISTRSSSDGPTARGPSRPGATSARPIRSRPMSSLDVLQLPGSGGLY